MKLSYTNLILLLIIFIWAILTVIFGIYDLQISIAVVNETSNWGNFGADYGEVPGYGLIAIALATYLGGYIPNVKKQKILGGIGVIVGIIYLILGLLNSDVTDTALGATLILGLLFYVILTWNKDWKDYRKISGLISILAILNPLLLVQIIKLFWGRVRFRDLSPSLNYDGFTPWFILNGFTGNYSFPSGHAAMGWMFLPLLILVKDKKWSDPIKIITYILVLGWGIFVALSRVIVGAHYASDVLFSTFFAMIITLIFYKKLYK
jgi:membrane-associated phospholipid phosphatase